MIALIVSLSVIGGIFLIFAIVLACPVIVDIQFKDSFVVKIKILGIPITVFPQKEKPQSEEQKVKKKKKKKPEEEKEKTGKFSKIKGILESKGLSGLLDFFKELAQCLTGHQVFQLIPVLRFHTFAQEIAEHLCVTSFPVMVILNSNSAPAMNITAKSAVRKRIFFVFSCCVVLSLLSAPYV